MNLKDRLDKLSKRPHSRDAIPISSLAPMSQGEVKARSEASLRRHMKSQGKSDADVDTYLGKTPTRHAAAA